MSSISLNQLYVLSGLCHGPAHGYALRQRLEDLEAPPFNTQTVNATLQQLAGAGLVEGSTRIVNGRITRTYTLTLDGFGQLADSLAEMDRLSAFIKEAQQMFLGRVKAGLV